MSPYRGDSVARRAISWALCNLDTRRQRVHSGDMTTTTLTLNPDDIERIIKALHDHADSVRIPAGLTLTLGAARVRQSELAATNALIEHIRTGV